MVEIVVIVQYHLSASENHLFINLIFCVSSGVKPLFLTGSFSLFHFPFQEKQFFDGWFFTYYKYLQSLYSLWISNLKRFNIISFYQTHSSIVPYTLSWMWDERTMLKKYYHDTILLVHANKKRAKNRSRKKVKVKNRLVARTEKKFNGIWPFFIDTNCGYLLEFLFFL